MSFQPPILYTNIEYLLPDNNFDNANTNNMNTSNNTDNMTLALGAGCYWGTEKFIVRDFQKRFPNSIVKAKVGFMNPNPKITTTSRNPPTYREVCSGITGYLEVLDITLSEEFASNPTNLEELFRFFFMFHDPTTKNRQGNDVGTQYASAIFFTTPQQQEIALKVQTELQQAMDSEGGKFAKTNYYQGNVIETKITPYTEFVEAHEEHQRYLEKNPSGYCNHYYRFRTWPEVTGASGKKEDAPKQEKTNTEQKKKGSWSRKVMKSLTKKVVTKV